MLTREQDIAPDANAIRADLEFMTARWHELQERAMFEVRAFKEGSQPQTFKYSLDWMDDAIACIVDLNRRGYNLYAVRNPIRATYSGSAKDTDIIAAFFLWADCDDPSAAGNVRRFDGPKWTASVVTGTVPTDRAHVYWALKEPCYDLTAWRDLQATIAAHFGSDASVINPSRIMRIGGTVTWPFAKKRERGYIEEVTTLRTVYADERPAVSLEQMQRVFSASRPLSERATPQAGSSFEIETGLRAASLDRERLAIQAMSGTEWHNAVIRLVASYVAKGLSDAEIHALTQPLTLSGYTAQQTADEVQTAIDGARKKGWTPQQYATLPPQAQAAPEDACSASTAPASRLEWFDDLQPVLADSYLVKGVMGQGAMSVIYGPSNSGKTFFALDLAFHVAIGAVWRGRRVRQAAVLYLAAEGGRGVANRVAALRIETGVCDVPFALRRAGLDLLHDQANLKEVLDLAGEVQAKRPEAPLLIVIDTLSRVMAGGDENSPADMTALIRNIDAIREATGAHISLIHHSGKDTARGARGHSSLRAATDTEIEVSNEGGARAAMVTKQRDYQGGEVFAFGLKSITLGHDQDGDEVATCVVTAVDAVEHQAAVAQKKGLGGNQKLIADTFDQMIAEGLGRPNPGGVGMPETGAFWAVSLDDLRSYARGKMVATDTRSAFNQAMKALTEDRGLFVTGGNMVWRTDRKVSR